MHLFAFIMHFFMLCLEKSEFFVKLLVVDTSFGSVDKEHAHISKQQICRKDCCHQKSLVEPVSEIRNQAVQCSTYDHPGNLPASKSVRFIKICKEVYLDISDDIAGEDHLGKMQYLSAVDAVNNSVYAIEEKKKEKVKTSLEFYSDFFSQVSFPQ